MNKLDENESRWRIFFPQMQMKTKNLNKIDLRKVEGISSQNNKVLMKHLAFLKSRHLCLQQVARL